MHTRYSPVRRSPPKYCYLVLPLDLHVLSLPLALILSQDQTLHCKIYLKSLNEVYPCLILKILTSYLRRDCQSRLVVLHNFKELFFTLFAFGTSKIIHLFRSAKFFEIIFPAVFSFPSFPFRTSRITYLFKPFNQLFVLKAGANV